MPHKNAHTRTFARTVEALGSVEAVAAALSATVAQVEQWLAGTARPPAAIFIAALDIVARGRDLSAKATE